MDIKIIALLTPEGFDQRFWEVASETKTYKEAYELVEKEYQENFRQRKYSDYNSFRNCRDRRLKSPKNRQKK
jgi:hypothetical protein|tara:strand:- start:1370 stop:1585 length:216 start_codon:yes stop_codon:yes gene_type:complete